MNNTNIDGFWLNAFVSVLVIIIGAGVTSIYKTLNNLRADFETFKADVRRELNGKFDVIMKFIEKREEMMVDHDRQLARIWGLLDKHHCKDRSMDG